MAGEEGEDKQVRFDALVRALSDDPMEDSSPSLAALDEGWEDEVLGAFDNLVGEKPAPAPAPGASASGGGGVKLVLPAPPIKHVKQPKAPKPPAPEVPQRTVAPSKTKRERKLEERARRAEQSAKAASNQSEEKTLKAKKKADAAKARKDDRRRLAEENQKSKTQRERVPRAPDRETSPSSEPGAELLASNDLSQALARTKSGERNRLFLYAALGIFVAAVLAALYARR